MLASGSDDASHAPIMLPIGGRPASRSAPYTANASATATIHHGTFISASSKRPSARLDHTCHNGTVAG
jgi:hypothetical protein